MLFLDGDYSDYPEQLAEIVAPILVDDVDFVIGARTKHLEVVQMTTQQIFGNVATSLMRLFFKHLRIWITSEQLNIQLF